MSANKIPPADIDFANAIRRIAIILRDANAALRKAASRGETSAVLDYLDSGKKLGAEERETLRELLAGESGRPKGRSGLKHGEIKFRCDAIEAFRKEFAALKAKGASNPRETAIENIAGRIGRSKGNLGLWLTSPKVLAPEMKRRKNQQKIPPK